MSRFYRDLFRHAATRSLDERLDRRERDDAIEDRREAQERFAEIAPEKNPAVVAMIEKEGVR